jgi:hypothetical protein
MSANLTWKEQLAEELEGRSIAAVFAETLSMILINLISGIGNLLVCFVIYKTPYLQTKTNLYVLSLAISDTLTSLFVVPLTTGALVKGKWVFGNPLCKLQGFLFLLLSFGSLHTMALIAVNRHFCVVKPAIYRRYFKKKPLAAMLVFVWGLAFMTGFIPLVAGAGGVHFEASRATCFVFIRGEQPNMIFVSFCLFIYILLPFALMIYCYALVFRNIRQHKTHNTLHANLNVSGFGQVSVEELKVTRLLFALVVGFTACWMPCIIVEMLEAFLPWGTLSRSTYMAYVYLVYLSSAINPVLYGTLNRAFKRATIKLLRCGHSGNIVTPFVISQN